MSTMFRASRIAFRVREGSTHVTEAWQSLERQPSWIVKAVAFAFLLVIAVPIIALVLLAVVVAVVLFTVLWCVNAIAGVFRRGLPRDDGRENVRVIRRDRPPDGS